MEKIIYKKVGERLKFARELRGITLEEAGNKVNVHKTTVLRWENGDTEKFKIPTLEILADLYDVNPAWIMGYDVPMERKKYSQYENSLDAPHVLSVAEKGEEYYYAENSMQSFPLLRYSKSGI